MSRSRDFREFLSGFIEAAQWASTVTPEVPCTCGAGKDRGADCAECDPQPIEADQFELGRGEVVALGLPAARWLRANLADATEAADRLDGGQWTGWERVGHDLWLTSAGAGVGFWDRTELDGPSGLADRLTAAARDLGAEHSYAYLAEDDGERVVRFERLALTVYGCPECGEAFPWGSLVEHGKGCG